MSLRALCDRVQWMYEIVEGQGMERVAFVILHYGDQKVTNKCVQSILGLQHREKICVVIVDNEIRKPTEERERIKSEYHGISEVRVLLVQGDGGFSYANNVGYQYARDQLKADWIIVTNNDVIFPQRDFLYRLESSFSELPSHILGPDVLRPRQGREGVFYEHQNPLDTRLRTIKESEITIRSNQIALRYYPIMYPFLFLWEMLEEKRALFQKRKRDKYYRERHAGIVPFGACLVYTPLYTEHEKRAFEPETHFYYEEYLLKLRCDANGYIVSYDPSLKVVHETGLSTKQTYRRKKEKLRFVMEETLKSCKIYQKALKYNLMK